MGGLRERTEGHSVRAQPGALMADRGQQSRASVYKAGECMDESEGGCGWAWFCLFQKRWKVCDMLARQAANAKETMHAALGSGCW